MDLRNEAGAFLFMLKKMLSVVLHRFYIFYTNIGKKMYVLYLTTE